MAQLLPHSTHTDQGHNFRKLTNSLEITIDILEEKLLQVQKIIFHI